MDNMLEPGQTLASGTRPMLGTDDQGRDMLSAILYGMRISLGVAAAATSSR
jgi:peptide/nickel transport system permease protein